MAEIEQRIGGVPTLDEKDYDILRLLQRNAKLTVRDIAQRVHLSPTPTHERIKRLEQTGVIKQYAALLDNRKLNRKLMVLCLVSLKEHDKQTAHEFVRGIVAFKEVVECFNIAGEYDFMLKIITENMETYHDFFINYLGEVKGIGKAQSVFVMDIIKDTHELIP
ncbi:Lrp/AsnC family transcriptional regulator [Spirosoma terrae]|uniref:Lrp/AsnC family transcriptional regulator n=1 Tax=Spirosoma terrae TaxID=1968276 RepID=A0A6L9LFH2_9BACT|nr:Lrp/AsnC family transcriptional regulator [Spirosoma terrae]NDU97623.1 Lrp/AsnC family transcriptional regulator [Spirosoma terrae]